MGSEEKMKRMSSRMVTCLALLLSCLFMISSCDARSIAIQQVTGQRQSPDQLVTEDEGSDQLTIVVDEPQSSYAQETNPGNITRTLRTETPSSYLLKIKEFSELSSKPPSYESAAFDASGHTWRMVFFPNGNNQKDYISLYVRIENLPDNSEVDVDLKLFVYNQHQNKYLTIQDGNIKRFNKTDNQWGFEQLLSLSIFKNSSNGYLVDDTCLLGAEIFVLKPPQKTETLSWKRWPETGSFGWNANLSAVSPDGSICSSTFQVGDRNWRVLIFPNGVGKYENKSLSVAIATAGYPPDAAKVRVYGWATVRLLSQLHSTHYEKHDGGWYFATPDGWYTIEDYISLKDLHDASNGYCVDDIMMLEVYFDIVSVTKVVSNYKKLGISSEVVPIFM